jgi:hypothetical protein
LVIVVGWAYALARIPVGCFASWAASARPSPCRARHSVLYWGWFAVVITGSAIAADLL